MDTKLAFLLSLILLSLSYASRRWALCPTQRELSWEDSGRDKRPTPCDSCLTGVGARWPVRERYSNRLLRWRRPGCGPASPRQSSQSVVTLQHPGGIHLHHPTASPASNTNVNSFAVGAVLVKVVAINSCWLRWCQNLVWKQWSGELLLQTVAGLYMQ